MSTSLGNELKDGYKPTDKWIKNDIAWMTDLEQFYKERALIEKEYSTKLQALCNRSFKRKAEISTSVSVGDTPVVTPGSLESASLVAWNEVLSQSEKIAMDKLEFSQKLETNIAKELANAQNRYNAIRHKWKGFHANLITERDAYYEEVNKAKKAYDTACSSMESQRSKKEHSSSEKAGRKVRDKEVDMNVAKNRYLVKINVANRLKDKYYYQDLPELLDTLQAVNESRVSRVNFILKNADDLERRCNAKVDSRLNAADDVISQNDPHLDTAMFIRHNASDFREPQDFYYIPSPIWHDDDAFVVDKEEEFTQLKKDLTKSIALYEENEKVSEQEKQKYGQALELKKELKDCPSAQDFLKKEDVLSSLLFNLQNFAASDNKKVISEVEIETIQNASEGKDLTLDEPTTKKKSRLSFLKLGKSSSDDTKSLHSLSSRANTIQTHSSVPGRLFGALHISANEPKAKSLYDYEAAGSDEVSLVSGEQVHVIVNDDGSGWTTIKNASGQEGLVPTSYLDIPKKKGPKVAPRKKSGKKTCQALFDYEAQGDDEISLVAGDTIAVVTPDDGSGWTEGEIDGQTGLFPTSYVNME